MDLLLLPHELTVCQVPSVRDIDWDADLFFVGRTDEEISLVCPTEAVPPAATAREDGWRALRVRGVLDFSLTGVLSKLASPLAGAGIPLFAVSTYNTDYLLVKAAEVERAAEVLTAAGARVERAEE